jgi:hypothetical protein
LISISKLSKYKKAGQKDFDVTSNKNSAWARGANNITLILHASYLHRLLGPDIFWLLWCL